MIDENVKLRLFGYNLWAEVRKSNEKEKGRTRFEEARGKYIIEIILLNSESPSNLFLLQSKLALFLTKPQGMKVTGV
jgi:hypothetical protein